MNNVTVLIDFLSILIFTIPLYLKNNKIIILYSDGDLLNNCKCC